MSIDLPELAVRLLDSTTFTVLCTVNPDGGPQSSVIWATRDGNDVLFSTIHGRRKTLNMARDPRVSLCAYDPASPYRYVEIRGTVSMTEQGGEELIHELARKYTGQPFQEGRPGDVRVVCRLRPRRIVVH